MNLSTHDVFEAGRPLIYATHRDGNRLNSFTVILDYLREQHATVGDLYCYLQRFYSESTGGLYFRYILSHSALLDRRIKVYSRSALFSY